MKVNELYSRAEESSELLGEYITSGDDCQYKVGIIGNYVCLCFQGSRSDEDWRNNFRFARKLYKNQESCVRFHRGFARVYKSCNDEIMEKFINLCNDNPNKRPLIFGHSMGAALSLVALEDFHYRTKRTDAMCIGFGTPKVCGNKKTAKYLATCGDVYEFSEHCDIVIRCPPLPFYRRVNNIYIGRKFNLIEMFKPQIYHQLYGEEAEYGDKIMEL